MRRVGGLRLFAIWLGWLGLIALAEPACGNTLSSYGANCNGGDDSVGLSMALTANDPDIDGQGKTCHVSGNFSIRSNTYLHDVILVQTGGTNHQTLTTSGTTTVTNIHLANVTIDRNGTP